MPQDSSAVRPTNGLYLLPLPTTAIHDCALQDKKMQFSTSRNCLGAEAEMWQAQGGGEGEQLHRMQLIKGTVSNSAVVVQ